MDITQVPAGYKLTDLGVLPDEWKTTSLIALAGKQKARFDDGDWIEAEFLTESGIRLIQTGNIGQGEFIPKSAKKYISPQSFKLLRCKALQPGDLLICRLAEPAGRACVMPQLEDDTVITSVDVTIFRPLPEVVDRRFLLQYFNSNSWLSAVNERCGGSTRSRIARGVLGKMHVPLPPLAEQQAIASALGEIDALLVAQRARLAKQQAVKQGLLQGLLSRKQRLPGFAGKWEVKRLGEVLEVRHGRSQKDVVVEDGIYPILASGGEIGRTNTYLYNKPSVLIGRKGTIDVPRYMETPFWTVDTLFYTEVFPQALAKYLFYLFNTINWYDFNEASGVPSLNAATIEKISVKMPAIQEQRAIAAVLSEADAYLAALEAEHAKTQLLKQGMMQNLLTGKLRLV